MRLIAPTKLMEGDNGWERRRKKSVGKSFSWLDGSDGRTFEVLTLNVRKDGITWMDRPGPLDFFLRIQPKEN